MRQIYLKFEGGNLVPGLANHPFKFFNFFFSNFKDFLFEFTSAPVWLDKVESGFGNQVVKTLVKFGKLKATKLLMYGIVREASLTPRKAFVEIELHLSSLETKQHLWGQVFARRYYLPGQAQGIVDIDDAVREVLRQAFNTAAQSLRTSEKLKAVKTVVLVPLAGDIRGYITGLAENMVSQTPNLVPRDLGVQTLAEGKRQLRDQPQQADALLYGAIRDLSRELEKEEFQKKTYRINVEVQLKIQEAKSSDVLWSETLHVTSTDVVQDQDLEDQAWFFFKKNPKVAMWIGGAIVAVILGLIIVVMFLKAVRRPR